MSIGYDNIPALFQTVLDIPMLEGGGALAHDIARPPLTALDHTATLTGATIAWAHWPLSNVNLISFTSATPDFLVIPAAQTTDLDYQAGAFSGMAWVYPTLLAGNLRYIFCKGGVTTGWSFWIAGGNGAIYFATYQGGPTEQQTISAIGLVALNTWCLLGFSRLGAAVSLYLNGVTLTPATVGVHVNPASAVASELHIGVTTAHAAPFQGYIWRPILFGRQVSAIEHAQYFEMTKGLFGV